MGVDLVGRGLTYNWSGWERLFLLGKSYGWEPSGTHPPSGYEGSWNGSYFSNDFQIVTREDAKRWSDAILKAIAEKRAANSPVKDDADPRVRLTLFPWHHNNDQEISWLEKFARVASEGELVLG